MIWLILLLIVVLVFVYLLVAPFYLEIDSVEGLCRIRFHFLASAKLRMSESSLILDLKIIGVEKQIDLLAPPKQKKKPVQKKIGRQKKRAGIPFRKVWAMLQSFRINKCDVNFDFGDMPLNGILYPLFQWISILTGKSIRINFGNETKIILEIENNFARIGWAFIKSSFTNLKNKTS
ncbi:MAG TPA: hypothetical protein VE978_02320 [Chitinophagales bacterium]|nr:hypothetical protein [Chitinophagales bacterium]